MTSVDLAALPYRPCVGVVLVNAAGRIFAGQRIDTPGEAWQMPQGGIDAGEDPEAAALRELWEETGVTADKVQVETRTADWLSYDLPAHLIGKIWKGRYRGQKQIWFLLRFSGTDADIKIDGKHPEFERWQWMAPQDLIASIVPFKREIYVRVMAEFADRL
ncbi:MAG: RNA pyrophosphohydrolase [Qingshengfaniella sp.]